MASKYFLPLDFTFENLTNEFITITSVKVEFQETQANSGMSVPMGDELVAWSRAVQQNAPNSDYNTVMVLGSIAEPPGLSAPKATEAALALQR